MNTPTNTSIYVHSYLYHAYRCSQHKLNICNCMYVCTYVFLLYVCTYIANTAIDNNIIFTHLNINMKTLVRLCYELYVCTVCRNDL